MGWALAWASWTGWWRGGGGGGGGGGGVGWGGGVWGGGLIGGGGGGGGGGGVVCGRRGVGVRVSIAGRWGVRDRGVCRCEGG